MFNSESFSLQIKSNIQYIIIMFIFLFNDTLSQFVGAALPTTVIQEEIGHGVVSAFRYAFIFVSVHL